MPDGQQSSMNIIIVAKPDATPTTLDFRSWRTRGRVGAIVAVFVLSCIGIGFIAAKFIGGSRAMALHEIKAMRDTIAEQQQALAQLEGASHRDMDALAVQLGGLQAQATRLNALGQRLTEVGKLGDGEFDFSKVPGLGGSEDPGAVSHPLDFDLATNIASLQDQFSQQEAQLRIIENLLLDRKLEKSMVPAGYPVNNSYVGSPYGSRVDPINGQLEHHLGLDFDAEPGSDIKVVAGGVVVWSGERAGYGNVVDVDHGNGYMTRYAHNQQNLVRVGERVRFGQVIGKVGSTGRSTGPHCHFEVWLNGHPVNPYGYVNGVKRA